MRMGPRDITFLFENSRISAVEGDSIAKALFEAGIRTLSYSVKYKRRRGIHCARGRCIMCHMEVNGVPGVPTCITPVEDGMRVRRENFRPFFSPLLVAAARVLPFPAGFYYRMFTRPTFVRRLFLGTLRRMAAVGRVDTSAPQPRRSTPGAAAVKATYDVAVVGAGLSGMAAAAAAARSGASVLLIDEYGVPGGHSIGFQADAAAASARDDLVSAIESTPSIDRLHRTTAQGFYPPDVILLGPGGSVSSATNGGMRRVRASSFIFATGGYDIVPLFKNNDTPGVFGVRALRLFLERDGLRPGKRAVVYGTGDELSGAARLLQHHGIDVAAIVNPGDSSSGTLSDIPYHGRSRVESAHGGEWLRSIRLAGSGVKQIDCDLLCTAFRGQGAYELAYQAGFRFEMSDGLSEEKVMLPTEQHRQSHNVAFHLAGELAGHVSWRDRIASGTEAGTHAVHSKKTT